MSSPCVMTSGTPSFDTPPAPAFASAIFTLTSASAFASFAGVGTATETLDSFTPPSASTAPGERPLGIARLRWSRARAGRSGNARRGFPKRTKEPPPQNLKSVSRYDAGARAPRKLASIRTLGAFTRSRRACTRVARPLASANPRALVRLALRAGRTRRRARAERPLRSI